MFLLPAIGNLEGIKINFPSWSYRKFWTSGLGLLMPSMFPDLNRSCEALVQSCADSHVTGTLSWCSQDRDRVHAVPGLK